MIKVGRSKLNKSEMLHINVVLVVKQIFPSSNNLTMQRLINPSHINNDTFRHPPGKGLIEKLKPLGYMATTVLEANGCTPDAISNCEYLLFRGDSS